MGKRADATACRRQTGLAIQPIDGCQTRAPPGGEATGANPTAQAKGGVKRHLLTEAGDLPVGLVVSGAHVHDVKKIKEVLNTMSFLLRCPAKNTRSIFVLTKVTTAEKYAQSLDCRAMKTTLKAAGRRKRKRKNRTTGREDGSVNGLTHG